MCLCFAILLWIDRLQNNNKTMPFKKGQSGNPKGRPKKNSATVERLRESIEKELPTIISQLTKAAKDGDIQATKLLLDRSIPAIKPIQQTVTVEGLNSNSLSKQGEALVTAMGNGHISAEQAQSMLSGLTSLSRIKEIDEIERRISALEETHNNNN